jgi:hypothetical protein
MNMTRRKLKPSQQKFWNRLTGQYNRTVREQIIYMRKNGTLTQGEADYLVELSYTATEGEIWRLIIDHIRAHTLQDFNMNVVIPARKSHKKSQK